MLGVAAVDVLAEGFDVCVVVGLQGYLVERKPLMDCVADTQKVAQLLENKDFQKAFEMRGSAFREFWDIFVQVSGPLCIPRGPEAAYPVAIATVGAPAPGMNHCCRVAARLLIARGHKVFFVRGGFEGLEAGSLEAAEWMSCTGWSSAGGAFLGTGRKTPTVKTLPKILDVLAKHSVKGLIIIGGFEAYTGADSIRRVAPNISIAVIPATISLNVPGTHVSIGMDRASNNLASSCDAIKQSCIGYQKRVYVVESIGKSCGFQSLFGAIASGADQCFIPEDPLTLPSLEQSVAVVRHRFTNTHAQICLMINSETSSTLFTTSFLKQLHETALQDIGVSARESLLSGIQQGGDPTPMDRIFSGRLALAAVDHISKCYTHNAPEAVSCGLINDERVYTKLKDFERLADMDLRRPLKQFWLEPLQKAFKSVSFPPQKVTTL